MAGKQSSRYFFFQILLGFSSFNLHFPYWLGMLLFAWIIVRLLEFLDMKYPGVMKLWSTQPLSKILGKLVNLVSLFIKCFLRVYWLFLLQACELLVRYKCSWKWTIACIIRLIVRAEQWMAFLSKFTVGYRVDLGHINGTRGVILCGLSIS